MGRSLWRIEVRRATVVWVDHEGYVVRGLRESEKRNQAIGNSRESNVRESSETADSEYPSLVFYPNNNQILKFYCAYWSLFFFFFSRCHCCGMSWCLLVVLLGVIMPLITQQEVPKRRLPALRAQISCCAHHRVFAPCFCVCLVFSGVRARALLARESAGEILN